MKYALIFKSSDNTLALDVKYISHVLRSIKITALPQSPDFLEGVVAYRDHIVPIVNLNTKFNKPDNSTQKRVILVKQHDILMGFLVDDILEVLTIGEKKVRTDSTSTHFVSATFRYQDDVALVIDPDRIFSDEEKTLLRTIY